MIDEIDKIKDLKDFDENLMIAPWSEYSDFRENGSLEVEKEDILKNVPNKKGNFIELDVEVLKDE